jgi:hypothetical protein
MVPAGLTTCCKSLNSRSVARTNSTTDRMRAQFRPWRFARAIHSHWALPIKPKTIHTVMRIGFIWGAVTL